jgi:phage tail sheath protein FI
MPSALKYPGVYVEEIPSGVRTIVGVATSIAAFIGRAARGPVDDPVTITSWADYERIFGGLSIAYPLGYAVRDFYQNGGREALIVRVFKPAAATPAPASANISVAGGLNLTAASPGTWANKLRARVETSTAPGLGDVATQLGVTTADLFNLIVHDNQTGATETFVNVTTVESARRVDNILKQQSQLVRVKAPLVATPPTPHTVPFDPTWTLDASSTGVAPTAIIPPDVGLTAKVDYLGSATDKTGLYALGKADLFNILVIPPDTLGGDVPPSVYADALAYCVKRRAMLIVDPQTAWTRPSTVDLAPLGIGGPDARNAAVYFPRVKQPNALHGDQIEDFPPSGAVAGIMARTDVQRGVWKAPAGIDAALSGAVGLSVSLNDDENGQLNPLGVNCLRTFPVFGTVVWGSRTMRGADQLADEYKYIPIRRLALFIEESLFRGIQWAVFEPNDEPLWAQIRLNAGAFMQELFRQGAFQGGSPRDAYFVKCDKDTTTQADINLGIVNIIVGFAPLKPAEFVVLKIQQIAGQIQA